jgi:hypothetical protein|nr:MAG TPA: major capsid protein [Caudoviricetes sp.]
MAIDAIARNKAEALIREQLVNTIQQDVPKSSTVMQLGTRLANMTSNQTKIPVLSMLPLAYWVNGDTGMKKTSKQEWDNVYMTAAELAVIVPVPEAVLADSSFDIMGEVQPRVREAMGAKIDNAILFGGERPTEWVMQQDARHNLPDLSACGGNKTPTGIAVTNSGYIVTNSAGNCKMQLQMRLTYYMPK